MSDFVDQRLSEKNTYSGPLTYFNSATGQMETAIVTNGSFKTHFYNVPPKGSDDYKEFLKNQVKYVQEHPYGYGK